MNINTKSKIYVPTELSRVPNILDIYGTVSLNKSNRISVDCSYLV